MGRLRSIAPAVGSAAHSAGMPDGGSGDADTIKEGLIKYQPGAIACPLFAPLGQFMMRGDAT